MGMMFTYLFLAVTAMTLGLFAAAELLPERRAVLAALAAVFEGLVFLMLAAVFYEVAWEGVPRWLMAVLPVAAAGFAFRMAWRRLAGLPA